MKMKHPGIAIVAAILAVLFLLVTAPFQLIAFAVAPRKYIARFKRGYQAGKEI